MKELFALLKKICCNKDGNEGFADIWIKIEHHQIVHIQHIRKIKPKKQYLVKNTFDAIENLL